MHRLIEQFPLERGAHPTRSDGMCAMEMVAWLAGEPHSDEPQCACPVIGALVRACNDVMDDDGRTRYLRPLVPVLVNSRSGASVERARGLLVLDTLVRQLVPAALRRQRRGAEAEVFAALDPITTLEHLAPVARALDHFGSGLRAARWVVQRAREGMPPARFVAGAVQVARVCNDAAAWRQVVELVGKMAAVGREQASPALV